MTSAYAASGNVEVRYSSDLPLTADALDRVRFDIESVVQVMRSRREEAPDIWLARPEGYQEGGHALRDSDAIRLVAWSAPGRVLYATDGCNTCRHALERPLGTMSPADLESLASTTQIPFSMLGALARALLEERDAT